MVVLYVPDWIEIAVKVAQIVFWLAIATVAWKTYFAAHDNLKNPVFTEYQKKKISSMQKLSLHLEEYISLPKQYDFHSDKRKKISDYINAVAFDNKSTSLSVYDSEEYRFISNIFVSISADPFIPSEIESCFQNFCEKRLDYLRFIFQKFPDSYISQNTFSKRNDSKLIYEELFKEIDHLEKDKNQSPEELLKVALEIKLLIKQEMTHSIPKRLRKNF